MFNTRYKLLIAFLFYFYLSHASILFAQPDLAAYLWRQGMVQTSQRGINSCKRSNETVNRYLKFALLAEKDSAQMFIEFDKYKEINLPAFQAAAQHFADAARHYRIAIHTFEQGIDYYNSAKFTASRTTDKTLSIARNAIKRQLTSADTAYKNAKQFIVQGNRAFNAGNRYFNQAVDEAMLKTDELLKKRVKYHYWPAS